MVTFEAICIGDELLEGRVRDANAAALGAALNDRGFRLARVRFTSDDLGEIQAALAACTAKNVVVCGGLGPTQDDRTRIAAAQFLGVDLVVNDVALEFIRERFAARGYEFTENNRVQAMLPAGARLLATQVGSAPGFTFERDDRTYFFFPGVPGEFRWFAQEYVLAALPEPEDQQLMLLLFHGLGESALETKIADLLGDADDVVVGYRADYPVIELKLRGAPDQLLPLRASVLQRVGRWCVGEGDELLPARLGRLLKERGESVTTAESCTAGGIAALITDVSGSSAWFDRGWVTYANKAKVEEVGVHEGILIRYGAVSAQTVCQMASGARTRAGATYGIAVSGIAGPGGGTQEKPVGTVHFGLATPLGTFHRRVVYRGQSRARVRAGTAYTALGMLLQFVEHGPAALGRCYAEDEVWSDAGISIEELA